MAKRVQKNCVYEIGKNSPKDSNDSPKDSNGPAQQL
jgi:hypothetical protein